MGAGASVPDDYAELASCLSNVQLERANEHLEKLKAAGVSDEEVLAQLMKVSLRVGVS